VNLRILKKLSKRAAPLLLLLDDHREQFRAEKHDNYTSTVIRDRTCFERWRCTHEREPSMSLRDGELIVRPRRGPGYIRLSPPDHPLKGTIMVGATTGYYEPEWDEETAWDALKEAVYNHFTDIDEDKEELVITRKLLTPTDFFRAAADIIGSRT
jgi:hypothetical protein